MSSPALTRKAAKSLIKAGTSSVSRPLKTDSDDQNSLTNNDNHIDDDQQFDLANAGNQLISNSHANLNSIADDTDSNFSHDEQERIPLSFLSHMITPFNGDSKELGNFLQNANNALGLALPSQRTALEMFIFSKISSEVKTKVNMCNIVTYAELRQKLKAVYSPIESYDYLMEQLETIKQKISESVREYYVRLDRITSKCLVATEKEAESHSLESEKRVIKRISLRRFTHHTIPELSQILRHKTFSNINEAFSLACEEEAYLINEGKLRRPSSTSAHTQSKYCRNCKTKTHNTKDCRNNNNSGNNSYRNNFQPNAQRNINSYSQNSSQRNNYQRSAFEKVCNYCKYKGHVESDCFKKRYSNNVNPNPRIAQASSSNHRNSLNYQQSQDAANLVDQLETAEMSYVME